jgi:hypothetical protein
MKRIRTSRPRTRREHSWPEDLPADPRDPDVVQAKALAGVVEQMQHVFHELHADGRHALCAVCDDRYGNPAR